MAILSMLFVILAVALFSVLLARLGLSFMLNVASQARRQTLHPETK